MIAGGSFDPLSPQAKEAIQRLRAFHRIVAEHSDRNFRTLVLNDGAAAQRDLSFRSVGPTHQFLARAFDLYNALQASEYRNGWPGARMFVATGFRALGSRRSIDLGRTQLGSILERLAAGAISADQAVREAASIERYFDVIPQLQANFAFTKAYVADSIGSRGGFSGPQFFVDELFFDDGIPAWATGGAIISFRDDRLDLSGSFFPVTNILAPGKLDAASSGIRNATQIASVLSGSIK
ncbi:hypothetical protein [Sphingorhabdus lacus]|nr:hypothetical protein [Sphingorhabdus lacus]